jgi:hypothetical protein
MIMSSTRNGVVLKTNGIISVSVSNGGTGYYYTDIFYPDATGGGGSGSSLFFNSTNGIVDTIIVDNPGFGYTTDPSISISIPSASGLVCTSTIGLGYLISCGFCDFTLDPSWDSINYDQIPNLPDDFITFNQRYINGINMVTIWTGSIWQNVSI